MLFSYIGPETILPLTSVVAALIGGLLLFWNALVKTIRIASRRFMKMRKRPVLVLANDADLSAAVPSAHFPGSSELNAP